MARQLKEDDWDSHWDRYAASARLNPAQHMRHRSILAALRRGPWPIERLLDVGSGQGDFLDAAVRAGAARAYAGFELSESGVRISRSKVPQADVLQNDLLAPGEEAARFAGWASAAVCSDVIEHLDDPVGFLRALSTYLAAGALLVLTVPGGPMSQFDRHIGHRRHYDGKLVAEVLEKSGFVVEHVWLAGFPFFNLYRLLVVLRGSRLIADVESDARDEVASPLAKLVMTAFDVLFKYNLSNCRFGWQVVALARKLEP